MCSWPVPTDQLHRLHSLSDGHISRQLLIRQLQSVSEEVDDLLDGFAAVHRLQVLRRLQHGNVEERRPRNAGDVPTSNTKYPKNVFPFENNNSKKKPNNHKEKL